MTTRRPDRAPAPDSPAPGLPRPVALAIVLVALAGVVIGVLRGAPPAMTSGEPTPAPAIPTVAAPIAPEPAVAAVAAAPAEPAAAPARWPNCESDPIPPAGEPLQHVGQLSRCPALIIVQAGDAVVAVPAAELGLSAEYLQSLPEWVE